VGPDDDQVRGLQLCLDAARELEALLPEGRVLERTVRTEWDRLAPLQGYPKLEALRDRASRHGVARMGTLFRMAIGDERALRRGRDSPQDRDELVLTLSWALDDGFSMAAGWSDRIGAFAKDRAYLLARGTMYVHAAASGSRLSELWEEAVRRRGSVGTRRRQASSAEQDVLDQ
jgi:hypothetical protein